MKARKHQHAALQRRCEGDIDSAAASFAKSSAIIRRGKEREPDSTTHSLSPRPNQQLACAELKAAIKSAAKTTS